MVSLKSLPLHLAPTKCRALFTGALAAVAAAGIAACAPTTMPPEQVEATPPKVSYTYGSDADLVEANRKAQDYCNRYSALPGIDGSIIENEDGTRTVTFRCQQTAEFAPVAGPSQPMHFTYRTDAELLRAIQEADTHCRHNGRSASTNVSTNPDGTKSMTFQCVTP